MKTTLLLVLDSTLVLYMFIVWMKILRYQLISLTIPLCFVIVPIYSDKASLSFLGYKHYLFFLICFSKYYDHLKKFYIYFSLMLFFLPYHFHRIFFFCSCLSPCFSLSTLESWKVSLFFIILFIKWKYMTLCFPLTTGLCHINIDEVL